MIIQVGNTSLNCDAFKEWSFTTFESVYKELLKGQTETTWGIIQDNIKELKTDENVSTIDRPRRKRKKSE